MLSEIRADFDRLNNLIQVSRNMPDDASGDAVSMINEYLCVAISGRLEQNIKQIFIVFSERNSKKKMNGAVSRLCQSFQNPTKDKICDLVSLFDKEFATILTEQWGEDGTAGSILTDMVGKRKVIAHQTKNNRDVTATKISSFYGAYVEVVTRIHDHFLETNT